MPLLLDCWEPFLTSASHLRKPRTQNALIPFCLLLEGPEAGQCRIPFSGSLETHGSRPALMTHVVSSFNRRPHIQHWIQSPAECGDNTEYSYQQGDVHYSSAHQVTEAGS